MSVEQFTVQPPSILGLIALILLVVTGVALLLLALLTGRRAKTIRRTFVALIILGLAIIGLGVWMYYETNMPSTITVGSGYVNIQSPGFFGAGERNVTSDQIASAYIGQLGSGNFTLSKQHGTNYDDFNIGQFTLGNGQTAYVVSSNSTDLIIQMNSGEYVILGTSNTDALATYFSQSVHVLTNS
jgi:hypothetical protein